MVLGLLCNENLSADQYADPYYNNLNKQKNKGGSSTFSVPYSVPKSNRSRKQKKIIKELKEEVNYLKITSYCKEKFPNDNSNYLKCNCEILDLVNIGRVCKDDWEKIVEESR